MSYLILALVLVALVAAISIRRVGSDEQLVVRRFGKVSRTAGPGLTFVVPLLERAQRVDTTPRPRWAVATTNTSDGVNAHVRVEYVVQVIDAGKADGDVQGAVESRLHDHVASRPAGELPTVGQTLDWRADSFVPGVLVELAEVTVCDVHGLEASDRRVNP
jgi:regulator of protease activity HflC (stomatin/prohibitin superfamily)